MAPDRHEKLGLHPNDLLGDVFRTPGEQKTRKSNIARCVGNISWGLFLLLSVSPLAVAGVPDKWETTGAMVTGRSNHTAINLPNGADSTVLIIGGTGPSGPLNSAELYDPVAKTFSLTTGPMVAARAGHTSTYYIAGQVLIVGGTGLNGPLNSAELYDLAAKTFTAAGSMATARTGHTATPVFGPRVLIAGGTGPNGPLNSAELYDPVAKIFSSTAAMATARAGHTATPVVGPKVLIAGGTGPGGPLSSAELYDPVAKTFSPTGSMGTARAGHTATVLPSGIVLFAGGAGPGGPLNSAELYDPVAKTFSPTGSMATARAHHTATVLPNGMILIAGGTGPNGPLNSAELYDPQTATFNASPQMGSVREQHAAALAFNGKVLIAGGIGPNGPTSSAELYCPPVLFDWQSVAPSAHSDFWGIAIDPEDERLWYVISYSSGIHITRDGGNTWQQHLSSNVMDLKIDPKNRNVVYASLGSDLYKSADQGASWSPVHSFPAVISDPAKSPTDSPASIDSILVSSVYGDIYIGLASLLHHGRVYKSSDGGTTWEISFESEQGLRIWDMEEDPVNGYLYFCTENPPHIANAFVMRSKDRGKSWEEITPLQERAIYGHGLKMQVHPVTQDVYYLTEAHRILYRSSDFGDTWTGKSVDINGDLIIDKKSPHRFFGAAIVSGSYVGGVYFSKDSGGSFTFAGLAGTTPSLALNGTGTKLFAADLSGLYVADTSIDTTLPTVTGNTPAGGATNVPVNSLVTATFSEAMYASTLNTTTFTLSGGIAGTVTYDPGAKTAFFTPSHNLSIGNTYTATITTGVTDLAGNPMASNYTWSFTTAVLPDLTGGWTTPLAQTCKTTGKSQRCSLKGAFTVSNIGNRDAASTSVDFYLSDNATHEDEDTQLKSVATGKLKPGKSKVIQLNLNLTAGRTATGKYIITVIDKDKLVTESDETNNQIAIGPVP